MSQVVLRVKCYFCGRYVDEDTLEQDGLCSNSCRKGAMSMNEYRRTPPKREYKTVKVY